MVVWCGGDAVEGVMIGVGDTGIYESSGVGDGDGSCARSFSTAPRSCDIFFFSRFLINSNFNQSQMDDQKGRWMDF